MTAVGLAVILAAAAPGFTLNRFTPSLTRVRAPAVRAAINVPDYRIAEPVQVSEKTRMTVAELGAATAAVVLCSLAGAQISALQADYALDLLGRAGLFNQDVLVSDILLQGLDAANLLGLVVLPLAVLYLAQSQGNTVDQSNAGNLENWACIVDDHMQTAFDHVCGPESFDSTDDGMVCVQDYRQGKLRWVCS